METNSDYLGREFLITREFDAPRELVFAAWTEPHHLVQWWGPRGFTNPVCEWNAQTGNKIYVVMRGPNGMDFPMGGHFVEVRAPEKLVMACGAMDANGVMLFELVHDVTFEERGPKKTFISIRSKVTKTTADAGRYLSGYEAGMTQSLERLEELFIAQTGMVVVERTLNAPVDIVWKAMTTNDDLKKWYFELPEFKAEVGFKFVFAVEHEGTKFVHHCRIMEVIPQKKLAYAWSYEGHPGESLVTFELAAEGGKTRVKVTHTGLDTFPPTKEFARGNFLKGWTYILGTGLRDAVEVKETTIS